MKRSVMRLYTAVMGATIRVDLETHEQLRSLAEQENLTMTQAVSLSVAALNRERRARRIIAQLDQLRSDPEAWADYTHDIDEAISDAVDCVGVS